VEQIRRQREEARELVRSGVNPNDHKKAERIENQAAVEATIARVAAEASQNSPFRAMLEVWLADGVARKDGNAELRRSFEKDVIPTLGDKPVRHINEHDIRRVLRTMVARGVNRMAVRVHHDIGDGLHALETCLMLESFAGFVHLSDDVYSMPAPVDGAPQTPIE